MENKRHTHDNTQWDNPKHEQTIEQPETLVYARKISGTAVFWKEFDDMAIACDKTADDYLRDVVRHHYAMNQPPIGTTYQLDLTTYLDKKKPKLTKKPKVEPAKAVLPYASPEFDRAWSEWELHRKEKKQPLTPSTSYRQWNKLAKMGEKRAIDAIEYSITSGYVGVFEPLNKYTRTHSAGRRAETADHYGI